MATEDQLQQYRREKAQYDAALVRYQVELLEWNGLTEDEKARRAVDAEKNSRALWSCVPAAILSFSYFIKFKASYSGDTFWLMWGGASIGILLACLLASRLIGLTFRAISFGGFAGGVCYFLLHILQGNVSNPPSDNLLYGVTAVVGVIVFLISLTRASHKDGKPKLPVAPTRPI